MSNTNEVIYDEFMDSECIEICNALNSIKGVRTFESCCGHGKRSFHVWFYVHKNYFENLHIIARIMCDRYGGFECSKMSNRGWKCELDCNDIHHEDEICFWITSGDFIGEEAYGQSKKIAENIYYHLNHNAYCDTFKIKK